MMGTTLEFLPGELIVCEWHHLKLLLMKKGGIAFPQLDRQGIKLIADILAILWALAHLKKIIILVIIRAEFTEWVILFLIDIKCMPPDVAIKWWILRFHSN